MKVLFLGGYGNISWWCTKEAVKSGHEVYLLNRGITHSTRRPIPKEVNIIEADYRNFNETSDAIKPYSFDVVCDFLCFEKEQAELAYELFKNKTKQYIFISTESIYKRHGGTEIFDENSEQYNENEASCYILGKLQSEKFFIEKLKKEAFPLTIVRPGYTLDTILPYSIGHNCYTVANRYLNNKPFLIAGNGENIWTFTASSDFAYYFNALLGNESAIGETFNIMSDNKASFNETIEIFARKLINKQPEIMHIPFEDALKLNQFMPEDLMYQRMVNAEFDTSKIKKLVQNEKTDVTNIENIVSNTLEWLNEDERRKRINSSLDEKLEILTLKYLKK